MNVTRRGFLVTGGSVAGAAMLATLPTGVARAATNHHLVVDGEPTAVIVLPPGADPQVTWAAEELVRLVRRSTGATLPISTTPTPPADGVTRLYLGHAGDGSLPTIAQTVSTLDPDGFLIAPHGDTVTLIGPTPWGTRFAVQEILESRVGVSWLMPTGRGEDTPSNSTIELPTQPTTQNPSYTSRALHPSPTKFEADWEPRGNNVVKTWGDRNRTHWRLNFHHNEWRMFDSAKFGDPSKPDSYHPEWYPIHDGETDIPPPGLNKRWHIRYTAAGVAAEAARQVIEFFDTNPTASSFSLGVSDGAGFSEDEMDDSVNQVGMVDMSPVYYAWVNEVTERVMTARPEFSDRLIGLLAYNYVNDPPPFDLHPNVVPFLTRDRYLWVDPQGRAEDQAHTLAWRRVARQLGWYDYNYGFPYAIPRVTFDLMEEVVEWGAAHGVIGQMSEMRYNWGEGPKAWAYAKKLWNANRPMHALVRSWCHKAAGGGGKALEEYFRHWEGIWMTKVPTTTWFRAGRNHTYFRFDDLTYLDVVTPEDVATAEELLATASAKADTDAQQQRVTEIAEEFAMTKASALSYPRDLPGPDSTAAARDMLDDALAQLDASVAHADDRQALFDSLQSDVLHKQGRSPMGYGAVWSGWNCKTMIKIADWVRAHSDDSGDLTAHIADLAAHHDSEQVRGYCEHLQLMINNTATRYGVNTGFESGDLTGWRITPNQSPKSPPTVTTQAARSGDHGLQLSGPFHTCQITQTEDTFRAGPGVWVTRFRYRVPEGSDATGVFVPGLVVTDAFGTSLGYRHDHYIPMIDSDGGWAEALYVDKLPDTTVDVRVVNVASPLGANGVVHIDDVEYLYYGQVSDGSIPGSVVVQQDRFTFDPDFATVIDDPAANDGKALRIRGDRQGTEARYDLRQLPESGNWRVYARVRLEVVPGSNMNKWGVALGTTDGAIRELFRITPFADGKYHYLQLPHDLARSDRQLYVAGINLDVEWIVVDSIELVPV